MSSAPDFLTLTRTTEPPRRAGWRRDAAPQPCLLPDSIELADDCTSLPDDHRYEPALAASPFIVEFVELDRLDPERAELPTEATAVASPATRPIRGPIGSLLVHLLVICLILAPSLSPPDIPQPIPIQLVLETPPPPKPEPQPAPPPPEPPGRLASEDVGDVNGKSGTAAAEAKEESVAKPAQAPDLIPPPPPPKPPPPREQVTALATPKVPPPLLTQPAPTPQQAARRPAEETHAAAHLAHVPGPSATRDEYLAYLVSLTKQHLDLLPLGMLGERRGETSLAVLVMADGTIARISVAQGSGYPDIDHRIEQMVAAVHRFPPLPQWYQGDSMELIFKLKFPEGLERH